jgi:succinate dehydrogenase hydrophobic anchor subunit
MIADFLFKFMLTTAAVWLVLELAQRCGESAAGLAAGLQITIVPALMILGLHQGDAFVAEAAIGGLVAVASSAVFAVVYFSLPADPERRSRRICTIAALGAAALVSVSLFAGQDAGWISAVRAFMLAVLACRCAAAFMRSAPPASPARRSDRTPHALIALLVGALSSLACLLTTAISPAACGLMAGLPTVCVFVLLRQHRLHGSVGVAQLLHDYVRGRGVRVAFMVLAACAAQTGWALALCLGLVGAYGWGVFTRDKGDVPNRTGRATLLQGLLAFKQRDVASEQTYGSRLSPLRPTSASSTLWMSASAAAPTRPRAGSTG